MVTTMSKILGNSLSEELYDLLRSKVPTAIVATVSDEYPNTTPVHLILAKDKTTLLMAMARQHKGTANIRKNGKVMICVCEEGNMNVSIKGDATVVKEHMDCNKAMCVVKVKIREIKDDSTHSETTCGIRYRCRTENGEMFIKNIFAELEEYP